MFARVLCSGVSLRTSLAFLAQLGRQSSTASVAAASVVIVRSMTGCRDTHTNRPMRSETEEQRQSDTRSECHEPRGCPFCEPRTPAHPVTTSMRPLRAAWLCFVCSSFVWSAGNLGFGIWSLVRPEWLTNTVKVDVPYPIVENQSQLITHTRIRGLWQEYYHPGWIAVSTSPAAHLHLQWESNSMSAMYNFYMLPIQTTSKLWSNQGENTCLDARLSVLKWKRDSGS
ncbi:unnamed protein product [Protopolystoma xenopodis]|uniref:Uncharacterized protein n=1 Tax=Protopolystoma xenopodis TaxID=117903 RepID=A0A448XMK4_9PLAT|nr:unnamed protein product [Protopolystoma xenopodis]